MTASIARNAFLPERITTMPPTTSPFAVELGDAAPHLGADLDARDVGEPHGARRRRSSPGSGESRRACCRYPARAPCTRPRASSTTEPPISRFALAARPRHRPCVIGRAQTRGIEHHLVLRDHAADGRHLGDVGHGLELVLEEPVLQRAQLRRGRCCRSGRRARTRRSSRRRWRRDRAPASPRAAAGPGPGSGTRARGSARSRGRCRPRTARRRTNRRRTNSRARSSAPGTDIIVVVSGYVTWFSTICGACPG